MTRIFYKILLGMCLTVAPAAAAAPDALDVLMERIAPGLSGRIDHHVVPDSAAREWFELSQAGDRPLISANSLPAAAMGLNHYLKYHAGVHIAWNDATPALPDSLPAVAAAERHDCEVPWRYYLNYCTHSYSMAFRDWPRWEREIDWMALHGINMPLVTTGSEAVWRGVMLRLGYTDDDVARFVAGPTGQAWWLMNNLEGWGGPNPDGFYDRRTELGRRILGRMAELGLSPVLPGYSGMLPHDAGERLALDVADPGLWCGFRRPAFLQPGSAAFDSIADIYYDEQRRLLGTAPFYSMDPFHEGGNTRGVDLAAAGRSIMGAMKRANPAAVWVIQGWGGNPRPQLIDSLRRGDLLVLDLFSESLPAWERRDADGRVIGYSGLDWAMCMLLNYGGNVGLHGKLPHVIAMYRDAAARSATLAGIGLTMEGIDNNPVMYELMTELPWDAAIADPEEWVTRYAAARYGRVDPSARDAWLALARSVYNCPADNRQQGPHESLFCARPSDRPVSASRWARPQDYYSPDSVVRAARLMLDAAPTLADNDNYLYDLVDITRQAVADRGRLVLDSIANALAANDKASYRRLADRFIDLMLMQDTLLGSRPEFRLGRMLADAAALGIDKTHSDSLVHYAKVMVTVWGPRRAAEDGGLHDYANREWQGLIADFYVPRWRRWFDARLAAWTDDGPAAPPQIDFFDFEDRWTRDTTRTYSPQPQGDPVSLARKVMGRLRD